MNAHPVCVISIFDAASTKLSSFRQNLFEENLEWLEEIKEEAQKAFGSASISLLPKTPGVKRKHLESTNQVLGNGSVSPNKCTSTFVDGGQNKKFKIDDMSTINESTMTNNETTILDDTNCSKVKAITRSKKGKARNSIKRSKRLVDNLGCTHTETSFLKDTPNMKLSHTKNQHSNRTIACSNSIVKKSNLTVVISPINHNIVQPRVASIIEQLKLSAQKQFPKDLLEVSIPLDDIKTNLFPTIEDSPIHKKKREVTSTPPCMLKMEAISKSKLPSPTSNTPKLSTSYKSTINNKVIDSHTNTPTSPENRTNETRIENSSKTTLENEHIQQSTEEDMLANKKEVDASDTIDQQEDKMEVDSGVSSDENIIRCLHYDENYKKSSNKKQACFVKCVKLMQLPSKSSPMKAVQSDVTIDNEAIKPSDSALIYSCIANTTKSKKGGNIVTNTKSFVNRPHNTVSQEDVEEQRRKKIEAKELSRGKALNEANDRKQKALELKKKQREDREKRLALQHVKRQEEEERRRLQLEEKARQIKKNQEEIRRQKEEEEKKRRAIREMKQNEVEARRLKEEEEHRRKVKEQIEEERRRCEMMQRKAEYEEQQRQKKRLENEKAEKERLKQIEEERLLHEERKKREFVEKEQHRLQVEKKLREGKEKERLEKQQREERLRSAEKEIEAAQKREAEQQKRNILREEISNQLKAGPQYAGKSLLNIKNTSQSSPKFGNPKDNFLVPYPPIHQSPIRPKPKLYNPPVVPLKLRKSNYTTYNIDDLASDDSTDDESEPTKRVPSWAQGMELRTHLMQQYYANINPEDIFVNCMEPCRLDKIFQKNKERYFRRTSSAHWDSPLLKRTYR